MKIPRTNALKEPNKRLAGFAAWSAPDCELIARQFGVTHSMISRIRRGQSWAA